MDDVTSVRCRGSSRMHMFVRCSIPECTLLMFVRCSSFEKHFVTTHTCIIHTMLLEGYFTWVTGVIEITPVWTGGGSVLFERIWGGQHDLFINTYMSEMKPTLVKHIISIILQGSSFLVWKRRENIIFYFCHSWAYASLFVRVWAKKKDNFLPQKHKFDDV